MTYSLKRIYIALTTTLLILATAQVNASPFSLSRCCEADFCEIDCCNQPLDVNIWAELLYLRPHLGGLEAAFGNTTISTTADAGVITTTIRESDREPHFQWSPGFRLGTDVALDCFDLELDWMHFDGDAKFRDTPQHGHWKIRYDAVDFTFGRCFRVNPCFYFKPFVGIRAIGIHHKLKSHLETLFTAVIGNNTVLTDKDDKERFWGVGPELGFEVNFPMGCNFNIYGSFDVVTYYGYMRSRNFDTDTFTTIVSVSNGKKKYGFDNIATDAEVGISWKKSICYCCYEVDLMVNLGLEQHRIYEFSKLGSDGTLSLDGGVFGAGIGFRY